MKTFDSAIGGAESESEVGEVGEGVERGDGETAPSCDGMLELSADVKIANRRRTCRNLNPNS
jgi:hypothetical protein